MVNYYIVKISIEDYSEVEKKSKRRKKTVKNAMCTQISKKNTNIVSDNISVFNSFFLLQNVMDFFFIMYKDIFGCTINTGILHSKLIL